MKHRNLILRLATAITLFGLISTQIPTTSNVVYAQANGDYPTPVPPDNDGPEILGIPVEDAAAGAVLGLVAYGIYTTVAGGGGAAAGGAVAAAANQKQEVRVEGEVREASSDPATPGAPVVGATVQATKTGETGGAVTATATTDENGKYVLSLPRGEYSVSVTAPGFSPAAPVTLSIPSDLSVTTLTPSVILLQRDPNATIDGGTATPTEGRRRPISPEESL